MVLYGTDMDSKEYGTDTKEYQMIRVHFDTLVDTLGTTADPAQFARRLQVKSLISDGELMVLILT